MTIYLAYMLSPLLVWFGFALFTNRTVNNDNRSKRKYLIVCGIILFLMIGLRHYGVGSGDAAWYYNNWDAMANISLSGFARIMGTFDIENGYLGTVWLLTRLFEHPQFVFVFYGLLMAISVCRFIYRNCDDVVTGMMMFNCLGLWGFMVQGLRQGIAMCICLFALEFAKNRKLLPFLLTVTLATLYHASSIVFLAAYAFTWLKMDYKGYISFILISIVTVLMIDRIILWGNIFINDDYVVGSLEDTSGGFVSTAVYLIIIILSVLFYRAENDKVNTHMSFFFYMTLCGLLTFLMRYNVNTIMQRVSYYFMFGQIAVLPTVVNKVFVRRQSLFVSAAIIVLSFGIVLYKASYTVLVPYYFFWQ